MRIALSADMEGVSQLTDVREIAACTAQYWETGKPRLEADVAASCEGLLAGGATEVVVLDNHASGNTRNISVESLPAGARLEQWNLFELAERGVDAQFQVGYHARGGLEGFLSHTYVPGLRLKVGDELISESHGRAWAGHVPLLGITGNEQHEQTLGSLAGTPFLVVQESRGRAGAAPVFSDARAGHEAIRRFAEECARGAASATLHAPPTATTFAASMPNGADVVAQMEAGGWQRTGAVEFATEIDDWRDAQGPLATAMGAAFTPWMPDWLSDLATADDAGHADPDKAARLTASLVAWAEERQPEWYTEPAPAIVR